MLLLHQLLTKPFKGPVWSQRAENPDNPKRTGLILRFTPGLCLQSHTCSEEAPPLTITSGNNGINFFPKRASEGTICLADKGLVSTANICRLHKWHRIRCSKMLLFWASATVPLFEMTPMFFLENILCGALKRIVWRICFRRNSARYKRWGWTGLHHIFRFNLYLEL